MNKSRITTLMKVSFWQVFRLIFVLFSLYLMGDAFYRWDGFRYYGSFSEFLPSVSLATILWSFVAVFAALLIWLPLRVFEWFCLRIGWKIKIEHLLMFICIFVSFGTMVWFGKKLILPYVSTTFQLRNIIFLSVVFVAIFLTWLFRYKSEKWINIIQERITPLVWLFGIITVLSVPLVAYQTLVKHENDIILQENIKLSGADKKQPNIILVTFDALTSRDMSVYGYHRPTTPFISKWAKSAPLFTNVKAESNYTAPTIASLMTGKRVWTHQLYHPHGYKPIKSNIENLPLVLKKNGYYTMAFIVNPIASVKALDIANSLDIAPHPSDFNTPVTSLKIIDKFLYRLFGNEIRLHDWIIKRDFILFRLLKKISLNFSETTVPPEKAFSSFLAVVNDNPPEPFFVWIHLYPPHDPYLPPEPNVGMFDSSSELRTYKSQEKVLRFRYQYFPQQIQPTVNILRARYDEFIRYCDKQFEEFIKQLEKRNKLKNTVIILSSDHGESFEHNYLTHGYKYLYEQVTHIPLIIKESNQNKGRIIDDLVEQIDIPPTILELAGVPVPSWMEGRSLVPLIRGERLSPLPAFSMNFESNPSRGHEITKGTIAVWEGDYKLIHYLEGKKSQLFNLKKDPDELKNLFDKKPEVGYRLLTLIQDNLKKANERISKGE